MDWRRTKAGYGFSSIALHGSMLKLMAAVGVAMEFKSILPEGSADREAMATWRYTIGMSVFFLVWLRLLLRSVSSAPAIEPAPPAWQRTRANIAKWALNALMIGLPLVGWLTVSARETPVPFLGAERPAWIGKTGALAKRLKDIDEAGATTGYFLIGLHDAAALCYHYVKRDNPLRLMLLSH